MAERRVISSTKRVDPSLVGTTYTSGTPISLGVQDADWDCNSCGHKNILGNKKTCPTCNNPKDKSEEYHEPSSPRPYLSPEELAARGVDKDHGSDEECPACGSKVPPKTQVCPQCSSPIKNVGKTDRICPSCERESNGPSCPSCGAITESKTARSARKRSQPLQTHEPLDTVLQGAEKTTPSWIIALIIFVVIGVLSLCTMGLISYLSPKTHTAAVATSSWTCSIPQIENQYVLRGSWDGVPTGGDYVKEYEKLHHNKQVWDYTDPGCKDYWEKVGDHEEEGTPKEVCVDNWVYDYTETLIYDDGTKEEKIHTKNDPICHDEPTKITVDDYDWVEHCKPVEVYHNEPVNQIWYEYNIWEWTSITPASSSGDNSVIMCPVIQESATLKRNGQETITCSTTFQLEDKTYPYEPDCINEFPRYTVGSVWQITTKGPSITEVEFLP